MHLDSEASEKQSHQPTDGNRLRHPNFVALTEDKEIGDIRESPNTK